MKPGGETMLAIRQRKITNTIIQNGFSLDDFIFKPISNNEFNISYKPNLNFSLFFSGSKSQSRGVKVNKLYTMTPALNGEEKYTFTYADFDDLTSKLNTWLKALKENVEIGNPWDIFKGNTEFTEAINFDNYEEVFTEEDEIVVHNKLDLLLKKLIA